MPKIYMFVDLDLKNKLKKKNIEKGRPLDIYY